MSSSSSSGQPSDLLEVGRIERVHGLKGEVVVGLVTNMVSARTEPGVQLLADREWLAIETSRPHKGKWLVRFDGVNTRERAEALRGRTLWAHPLPASDVTGGEAEGFSTEVVAFVHELIGLRVVDQHGVDHGAVVSVIDNPAADLLELPDGRLVPLSFYQRHDSIAVTVDVPIGLLDGDEDEAGGEPIPGRPGTD